MTIHRFERQIGLFGAEGQVKLRTASLTIVGNGGLGTHVVQQAALYGVGDIRLVDDQELDNTNRNRYIGAWHTDPIPGSPKVKLAERLACLIDPQIRVTAINKPLISADAFAAIKTSNCVIGCLDNDGARLVLTELCSAYGVPYFDLASDVDPGPPLEYGGRVFLSRNGNGCLVCMGLLDLRQASHDLENPEERKTRAAIYGVANELLAKTGPSVVSINGVVASLCMTEFMAMMTGLREPQRLMNYYGRTGKVTVSTDEPADDCYYCKAVYGAGDGADVDRHLSSNTE